MQIENELWEIYDTTSSEVEMGELLYGLIRMLKPELVVETGCFVGLTTKKLGEACLMNNRGRVVSCDVNEDYVKRATARCYGLPVEIRHANSLGLPELAQADLVWSDSDYDARIREYEEARPGCVFLMHDTRLSFNGSYPPTYLGDFLRSKGGLAFEAGRGFGIVVKQ